MIQLHFHFALEDEATVIPDSIRNRETFIMKSVALFMLITLLSACSKMPLKPHESEVASAAKALGLTQIKSRFLDAAYLKPNTDFSAFKSIYMKPLDFSNTFIREPSMNDFDHKWELTEEDKDTMQKFFSESATQELFDKTRFMEAPNKTSADMVIQTEMLEIAPLAEKDKDRIGISKTYSKGAGTVLVTMKLVDAKTDEVLGMISDKADVGNQWRENNRVNNLHSLGVTFDRWMVDMVTLLGAE